MHLIYRTYNHILPLGIISDKYKVGDYIFLWGKKWYINCQPGKQYKHYYCVRSK